MEPKFNIDRPKIGDEEIKTHQNFEELVKQFKKQSLKQARGDESWRKNKKIRYSTVIAGITVICTVTLFALYQSKKTKTNETLTTSSSSHKTITAPNPAATPQKEITTNAAVAVKPKTTTARFIAPPSAKLNIGKKGYKVNNSTGGVVTHAGATKIKVPKNAFVDKAGKDIVGDVTIEYREFHDAGDIIASGIPMAYDSAGYKFTLETAGMFEITGNQNGKPVFIRPDKKLEVELASRTAEDRFNQYYLDTVARNWKYLKRDNPGTFTRRPNNPPPSAFGSTVPVTPLLVAMEKDIKVVLPKRIDSVKVIYVKKIAQLPKPKTPTEPKQRTPGRPIFNLDGDHNEFPELKPFKGVAFEVGPENNNYTQQMQSIVWSNVEVKEGPTKGVNYLLTLSYRNQVEKLIVYPVLLGDDYETAKEKYKELFEEYQSLQAKKVESEKRLLAEMESKQKKYYDELQKKQADYEREKTRVVSEYQQQLAVDLSSNFKNLTDQARASRLFTISQFGVFNSDCPHPQLDKSSVTPMFVTTEGKGFIQADCVYLVNHSKKTVNSMSAADGFKLWYDGKEDYSLCAFSQGKIYLCSKDAFSSTIKTGTNKFSVVTMAGDPNDLVNFKKNLEL